MASVLIVFDGWVVLVRSATNFGTTRSLLVEGNPTDTISETTAAATATTHNLPATVSFLGMMARPPPAAGKEVRLRRDGLPVSRVEI